MYPTTSHVNMTTPSATTDLNMGASANIEEESHVNEEDGDEIVMTATQDDTEMSLRLEAIQLDASQVCKLVRDRRSEEKNGMLYEKFPKDNKNNYATFRTDRPMLWFTSLQQYVKQHNRVSRCTLKKQKKINKVSILKMRLVFQETKEVFITLNFVTGVLSVKNKGYKEWVQNEFVLVSCHVKPVESEEVGGSESPQAREVPEKDAEESVRSNEEITNIWSALDGMKNAISSLEQGVIKLNERMDSYDVVYNDFCTSQQNKRKHTDKQMDNKIAVFQETITKSTSENLLKAKNELNNKVAGVKLSLNSFRKDIEQKFDTMTIPAKESESEMENKVFNLEKRVDKIMTIEDDLNRLDEHYTTEISEVTNLVRAESNILKVELLKCDDSNITILDKIEKLQQQSNILKVELLKCDDNNTTILDTIEKLQQHISTLPATSTIPFIPFSYRPVVVETTGTTDNDEEQRNTIPVDEEQMNTIPTGDNNNNNNNKNNNTFNSHHKAM